MICPYCSQPVAEDFQFCPTCGTALPGLPNPPADSVPAAAPALPVPSRTSGKAIGSLVCGLSWVGGLGSIAALCLGYLALREIRRNPLQILGKGMAIAGIVLGWVGVAALAFAIMVGMYFGSAQRNRQRKPRLRQVDITVRGTRPAAQSAAVDTSCAAALLDRPGSFVVISQQLRSASSLLTSCVCSACPALRASTLASSGKPTNARSPIRSRALCRPNSS